MTAIAEPLAPLEGAERIELIDVLRGFALLGILLVNMEVFAAPIQLWFTPIEWFPAPLDRAAEVFIRFFAQGKFYTLFSLLFGLGLWLQMERVAARGGDPARFVVRRMAWLAGIGLAHALLIWMGDILVSYAVAGLLVLPFRTRAPRTLVVWAAVLLVLPLVILALPLLGPRASDSPAPSELLAAVDTAAAAYSSGDLGQIFRQRAADVGLVWSVSLLSLPSFLGLFLLGLLAGRLHALRDLAAYLPLVRAWVWRLAALGFAGNLVFVVATEAASGPVTLAAWIAQLGLTLGAPALTLFYVCAIILLAQRASWRQRLSPLGTVGRMALSNYLLQSLICTAIFNGYGWVGLYGQVSTCAGLVLSFAVYCLQIPCSDSWLRRFRFGPAEWLWRSLTYGRRQPLRLWEERCPNAMSS